MCSRVVILSNITGIAGRRLSHSSILDEGWTTKDFVLLDLCLVLEDGVIRRGVMASIERLKVVRFTRERVPNPYPGGELPWQVYQGVRNAVVRTCRRHGPTGPMGEVRIVEGVYDPYRETFKQPGFWPLGDRNPSYYIISDQYNHERYVYAELLGDDPLTPAWVEDITETLEQYPGWGLGINNIPESYVLLFGDKLMVKGRSFGWSSRGAKAVEVARRLLQEAGNV